MQYVNPFSLLRITPEDLSSSPKLLRSAKKLLLAEIELEGAVSVDGVSIERSDALRIIDEFDSEHKRAFHTVLFYDESLRSFLTQGKTDWFFEQAPQNFLKDEVFLNLLLPFYATQFDRVLFDAVKTGRIDQIKLLQNSHIPLEGNYFDVSRDSIRRYFREKSENLENLVNSFAIERTILSLLPPHVSFSNVELKYYNPFTKPSQIDPIGKFEEHIFTTNDIKTLNALSDDFQNVRDNIARNIQNLAVDIYNNLDEDRIALSILKIAGRLKVGQKLRDVIDKNCELFTKTVLKNNLVESNELVDKILYQTLKGAIIKSISIRSSIDLVVDTDILNQLSSKETDNSIISIAITLSEIATAVNELYYDEKTSLQIIDKALRLKLSDDSVGAGLRERLISDRIAITSQNQRERDKKTSSNKSKSATATSYSETKTYPADSTFTFLNTDAQPPTREKAHNRYASLIGVLLILVTVSIGLVLYKLNYSKSDQLKNDEKQTSAVAPEGMVLVNGGEFLVGRSESTVEAEMPAHKVFVQSFYIDIYETTNKQYAEFILATKRRPPPQWKSGKFPPGQEKFPVVGVNWEDASAFATWKGKRLPTEEEWELAARGMKNLLYPWGNTWIKGNANAGGVKTGLAEVGAFKGASPFGVFDMVGNAWEWTSSDFKAYPNGKLPGFYKGKVNLKTIRGGSFESGPEYASTTYRIGWPATGAEDYQGTGIRCAIDAPSDKKSR